MTWPLLLTVIAVLTGALLLAFARRHELRTMRRSMHERARAIEHGADAAQLQHPVIDMSRCLGCGTCVSVCPEDGVLEMVHGQAMVVNGARCVGVSACERECPVDAITITIANVADRDDIPALDEQLEAVGSPGLFLAGEVTAHALIKTAIEHGTACAAEVAHRLAESGDRLDRDGDVFDFVVVGAGPAGLAASLEAKRHGLRSVTLDQEDGVGGTVAKYPRRKLVMGEPVDLPLHGRLKSQSYTKEQLIELWQGIAHRHRLPVQGGEVFVGLERDEHTGVFSVRTEQHTYLAHNVCLAIGRRGVPRQLGIVGEDLPKVAYSLIDAHSYQGRRVLVVGGGDSALEAALALAEQAGNEVVLSYRKGEFFRARSKTVAKLEQCVTAGRVRVLRNSDVVAIHADRVEISQRKEDGSEHRGTLGNDDVFVMIGGVPPFQLLQNSGVSFDPTLRKVPDPIEERGVGLIPALVAGLVLALLALGWALWHYDYYGLPAIERPTHDKHAWLRPSMGAGLWLGIASTVLIVVNLLYLWRRSMALGFRLGTLRGWMTSHVATGILALLCALMHGAMAPRDTVGGHAFWALVVLLMTGAIGRYFYAWVPRAANGRELQLVEVRARLAQEEAELDAEGREFAEFVRAEIHDLIERRQWGGGFFSRLVALFGVQFDLRGATRRITAEGRRIGIDAGQIHETVALSKHAHRTALMAAHYEDIRAVLNSWRYLHRWVAVLMVVLVVMHVFHALVYGSIGGGGFDRPFATPGVGR